MAKLARESRLRERRLEKQIRKQARKDSAGQPPEERWGDAVPGEVDGEGAGDPVPDNRDAAV